MGGTEMQRGYDDTINLTEMASGLVSRRFSSVDEAAKAVLAEDGGSNVDRLRRKFREQNWYEKGLSDHIDAEISRRGLIEEPSYHKIFRRLKESMCHPFIPFRRVGAVVMDRLITKPKDSLVAFSLATTLLLCLTASGVLSMEHALLMAVPCCVMMLVIWADKTSEEVTARTAALHIGGLGLLTAGLVAAFAYLDTAANYTLGSLQGTLIAASGITVMGVYSTSFVGFQTKKAGRRHTLEVSCLIMALSVFSQIGTAILVHDTSMPALHAVTTYLAFN